MESKKQMKKKRIVEEIEKILLYNEGVLTDPTDVVDNSTNTGICNETITLDLTCDVLVRE